MREDLRQAAIAATVLWARRFTPRPWKLAELVSDVRCSDSIYARAVTRWVRKIPAWRTTPHHGSKRVGSPAITPEQVDPWAVDETHLAQQSWHVTTCPTCDGDKKVQCPSCGGGGRVGCVECGASGRVISSSSKKFRTVNCRRCQGTGAMRCTTCRNGRVECPGCDARGKLEAWVAIDVSSHSHVGVWPHGLHDSSHPSLLVDNQGADSWSGAHRLEKVERNAPLGDGEAGPLAHQLGWPTVRRQVEPPLDHRLDRVTYESVTVYSAPVTRVSFAFSGTEGYLQLLGTDPVPSEVFSTAPLDSYKSWILSSAGVASIAVLVGTLTYLERDEFYRPTTPHFGASLVLVAAGLLLFVAAWRRRVGSPVKRPGLVSGVGIGTAVVGTALAAAVLATARPSLAEATAALDSGRLEVAERHLGALVRRRADDPQLHEARVRLALAQAEEMPDEGKRLTLLRDSAPELDNDPRIVDAIIGADLEQLEAALAGHDYAVASQHVVELLRAGDAPARAAKGALMAFAQAKLAANDPVEAEHGLVVAWHDFGDDDDYVKLGVAAILRNAELTDDLRAKVGHLRRATKLEREGLAHGELRRLFTATLAQAKVDAGREGTDQERLAWLGASARDAQALADLFPDRAPEVETVLESLAAARAELVKRNPVLGADLELLVAMFGREHVGESSPGVLRIDGVAGLEKNRVFAVMDATKVVGVYLVPDSTASSSLALAELDALFQATLGTSAAPSLLRKAGKGVKHTTGSIAGHKMVLGFYDTQLIEVALGAVKP